MKPPKSWLADYGDHKDGTSKKSDKTKTDSFGGNMDNSFRTYMAKKINLQREQFGLVLPPTPPDPDPGPSPVGPMKPSTRTIIPNLKKNKKKDESAERKVEEIDGTVSNSAQKRKRTKKKKIRFDESLDFSQRKRGDMKQMLTRLKRKHKKSSSSSSSSGRKKKMQKRNGRGRSSVRSSDTRCESSVSQHQPQPQPQPDHDECRSDTARSQDYTDIESNSEGKSHAGPPEPESNLPLHMQLQLESPASSMASSMTSPSPSPNQLKRKRKDLFFLGITVLVNGYTEPSSDAIMRMLHKHGGNLEKYETECVTHIIAENLSTAKAKIYKRQKRPIPVVLPKWIVDCVEGGKLLPIADYLLDNVRNESAGASMTSFYKKKVQVVASVCSADLNFRKGGSDCESDCESEFVSDHTGSSSHGFSRRKVTGAVEVHEDTKDDVLLEENRNLIEEVDVGNHEFLGEKDSMSSNSSMMHATPVRLHRQGPPTQSPASGLDSSASTPIRLKSKERNARQSIKHGGNEATEAQKEFTPFSSESPNKSGMKSSSSSPSNQSEIISTVSNLQRFQGGSRTVGTDPNFLESYFSSSRLSFIGSFKQRLEKPKSQRSLAVQGTNVKRFVFHVDMDCFFAAIAVRNFPQFRDKPVGVGHAWKTDPNGIRGEPTSFSSTDEKKKSYSELSTCNYKAREFGVKKGMFLHRARQLCPELVVLPYDYEGYEDASNKVGAILQSHVVDNHGAIEQVSCDESYLEFYFDDECRVGSDGLQPMLANERARRIGDGIRKAIFNQTKCTASIGIGSNKLLAKLATNNAKDCGGDKVALADDWRSFLTGTRLREIPGIGYRMEEKLQSHNLTHVQDIWSIPESELVNILGPGNGTKVYRYCHGEDDRPVKPAERKTIGAECNYGVRFDGPYGVDHMMMGLSSEVEKRMQNIGVLGRHITFKLKERQAGAGAPGKFNGHGKCNDHSKGSYLPGKRATRDALLITKEAMKLFGEIGVKKDQIRGMGIVMNKLESEDLQEEEIGVASWLKSTRVTVTSTTHDEENLLPGEKDSEVDDSPKQLKSLKKIYTSHTKSAAPVVKRKDPRPRFSNVHLQQNRTSSSHRPRELRSFFALAEIKSGEKELSLNGERVSLTQLDSLPLEIQLQVANSDGSIDQSIRRATSSISKNVAAPRIIRDDNVVIEIDQDSVHYSCAEDSGAAQEEEGPNDITVLQQWMNEHRRPSKEDVELVSDFLCICVAEKRLDDVVSFLRLVKHRWHIIHYQELLKSTEQSIKSHHGRKLDLSGLDL